MAEILLDIESAKFLYQGASYDRKQYSEWLSSSTITRTRWIPCASWRELGKKHIHTVSVLDFPKQFKADYSNDIEVIKVLAEVLDSTDTFIAHNSPFDWKMIIARMIYHHMTPPKRPLFVDTLKIARTEAMIEANDLRYLCWYLKLDKQKDEKPDWDKVAFGDAAEIKRCIKYNRADIDALEGVYKRLMPYSKIKQYRAGECPSCGSTHYRCHGQSFTLDPKKKQYKCSVKECSRRWTGAISQYGDVK